MAELEQDTGNLEIGNQAIWSVSSCKPGYGVSQLRDNSQDTYWQSDGIQPHRINIEFSQKTAVKRISIFADYKLDESYTPNKIAIRAGTTFHDLEQITVLDLEEPEEWVDIQITNKDGTPVKAFLFQIGILSNHQNGRDTHVRQVKVFEPGAPVAAGSAGLAAGNTANFESVEFTSMLTCR